MLSANGAGDSVSQPDYPLDNGTSVNEQLEHSYRLVEYLQHRTKLEMSAVVRETGLNSHSSSRVVLLTRTLKLIGSCLDDVINWAKSVPGAI